MPDGVRIARVVAQGVEAHHRRARPACGEALVGALERGQVIEADAPLRGAAAGGQMPDGVRLAGNST